MKDGDRRPRKRRREDATRSTVSQAKLKKRVIQRNCSADE